MLRDLYYAVWANLSALPYLLRAAIVVFVALLLIWLVARPVILLLLRVLIHLLSLGVKGLCLLAELLLSPLTTRDPKRYAEWYNACASWADKCNQRLMASAAKLTGFKLRIGRLILLYAAFMFLIALPSLLGSVVSENYLPFFSYASNLYQKMEAPALEASASYPPLFAARDENDSLSGEEEDILSNEDEDAEPEAPIESEPPEIWLSLSKAGRGGTNLREGPSMDDKVLTTVSGDIQLLYLGDQIGSWMHVRCPDGTEGWMHKNRLEELDPS